MLAEVDDRVGAEAVAEPGIGREIRMRRHQCRVMIGRSRVEIVAARRLDQHRDIAHAEAGDRKPAAIDAPRAEERVALGRTPLRRDTLLYGSRQAIEKGRIIGEGQGLLGRRMGPGVAGAGEEALHQRGGVLRHAAGAVPRRAERIEDRDRRLRGVEPDPVADAAVAVGVVGKDDRDPPLGRRRRAQPRPVAREVGDKRDPVGDRPVAD